MESNINEDVSSLPAEAETDSSTVQELQEIKQILLDSQETESSVMDDTETSVEVPANITEDDFIAFNNNFVMSISCLVLLLGIISGLLCGVAFRGIFRS